MYGANNALDNVEIKENDNYYFTKAKVEQGLSSEEFDKNNMDKSLKHLQDAKSLFDKISNQYKSRTGCNIFYIDLSNDLGFYYYYNFDFIKAMQHFTTAKHLLKRIDSGYFKDAVKCYTDVQRGLLMMQYDKCSPTDINQIINSSKFIHEFAIEFNLHKHAVLTAQMIGVIYRDIHFPNSDNLDLADYWFKESINHLTNSCDLNDSRKATLRNIIDVSLSFLDIERYNEKNRLQLAQDKLERLLNTNLPAHIIQQVHFGLAKCYIISAQLRKADNHLNASQAHIDQGYMKVMQGDVLLWLAHVEYLRGNRNKSIEMYKNAKKVFETTGQTCKKSYIDAVSCSQGNPPKFEGEYSKWHKNKSRN